MILITGPARTGTTFLICLFQKLGFDIGYKSNVVKSHMESNRGGLEWLNDKKSQVRRGEFPYVIKHPVNIRRDHKSLFHFIEEHDWTVDLLICTRRPMEPLIKSQIDRNIKKRKPDFTEETREWWEDLYRTNLEVLIPQLERKVQKYPHIFLNFPELVLDSEYLYSQLSDGLDCTFEEFDKAFKSLSEEKFVHFR